MVIDMPVSNVIRSTGKEGTITVSVFAAGLRMSTVTIKAETITPAARGISQPSLADEGRGKVVQNPKEVSPIEPHITAVIQKNKADLNLSAKSAAGYKVRIKQFLIKDNSVNEASPAFSKLLNILEQTAVNGNGHLSAEEINYTSDNYNRYSFLADAVDKTKLPSIFKSDLEEYYSSELITKGNDFSLSAESNRIKAIPTDAIIVVAGSKKIQSPGIVVSASTNIIEIVSAVKKEFLNLTDDEKEIFLKYISEINPWVKRSQHWTGDYKLNTKKEIIEYSVTPGRSIVIPDLKIQDKKQKQK